MKKTIPVLALILIFLCACSSGNTTPTAEPPAEHTSESAASIPEIDESQITEITEKMFIEQVNDVYLNPNDYLGKPIKLEGVFESFYLEDTDETLRYVRRMGPGCCGNDGFVGFEVIFGGEYPEANDWVELIGIFEEYEENDMQYFRIRAASLTVMDERGNENLQG